MNSNKRIFYYDFLRAIAIILVILVHVDGIIGYGFDSLKHAIPGLLTATTWPAVPIFLMLSGALLLNRSYTLSEFFKKRFARILYPFIFWVLVLAVIIIPPQTIQSALYTNFANFDILRIFTLFGVNAEGLTFGQRLQSVIDGTGTGLIAVLTGTTINLRSSVLAYVLMALTCMGLKNGLFN